MGKKAFGPDKTTTFALAGHRSSGKTSLAEVLLYIAGGTRRPGRVDDRSSLLDHQPAERRRGMTLELGFAWMQWQGHLLNLVDTPGSEGLSHNRTLALSGVDGALVVISAPDGIEYGTERVLSETRARGLPVVAVVNRMDRGGESDALIEALEDVADARVLPLQLPFFDDEGTFSGVISLLEPDGEPRVLRYDLTGSGRFSPEPIPERYRDAAARAREHIVETVALAHDELLEEYLEYLELPEEKITAGLARMVWDGTVVPVLYSAASLAMGAQPILNAITTLLPSPLDRRWPVGRDLDGCPNPIPPDAPFTAQLLASALDSEGELYHVLRVWSGEPPRLGGWVNARTGERCRVQKLYQIRGPRRTTATTRGPGAIIATWDPLQARPGATFGVQTGRVLPFGPFDPPMMSYLLTPLTRRDEDLLEGALDRLRLLDAALDVREDPLTRGFVLAGQGQMHLEHTLEVLRGPLAVKVESTLPPVPYRETPTTPVRRVRGLHRRTDGELVEEFGECWLDVVPKSPQEGIRFESTVGDEELPDRFVPPIHDGIHEATQHGPTAGYPVVGVGVRCVGGEYDLLSSEGEHFRRAGARALRAALQKSGTDLLEPWCSVRVEAAADEVGPVLSEIGSSRGRILDMEVGPRMVRIDSQLPYRELRTFAPRLQAVTGGRGRFTTAHSHYEKLPRELVHEAIAESPYRGLETNGYRPRDREPGYNA
jgi:elongation factor G